MKFFDLQDLKTSHNEELQIQVKVFEEHRDNDFEDLVSSKFDNIKQEFKYPFAKYSVFISK